MRVRAAPRSRGVALDRDPQHIWVVRRSHDSILLPVTCDELAQLYRDAGWQVTELPRSAFEESELRCLGVRPERPPG